MNDSNPFRIRKQVGRHSLNPIQRVVELNEFLKKNNLISKEPKNELIRRVVGPSDKK
ncbi:hypothetical protein HUU42_06800 [bacterium]|nr:hypothetical protein [bacterium]